MTVARRLVVNADDFERSYAVNEGIARAYDSGIVTSASLMVRWPAILDAVELAHARPGLGLGLHVDLGEWAFVDGAWRAVYEVGDGSPRELERAVDDQLARFDELVGRPPTHLDSHQHVHLRDPARALLERRSEELGVPLRGVTSGVVHRGAFYGQDGEGAPYPEGITVGRLVELIGESGPGLNEIACHPGVAESQPWSVYDVERRRELAVLCDPVVAAAVQAAGVELCTFAAAVEAPGGETSTAEVT